MKIDSTSSTHLKKQISWKNQ